MRAGAVLFVAVAGVFGLADQGTAQITSYVAQTIIIDGKNYVAGEGLAEGERSIADAAAKAPEGWDSAAQGIFRNMIFTSAGSWPR